MNVALLLRQLAGIYTGLTPYELHNKLSLKSTASVQNNLKSVFGQFWPLNLYFPAVLVYRQERDGTNWPEMKIVYRCKPGEAKPWRTPSTE